MIHRASHSAALLSDSASPLATSTELATRLTTTLTTTLATRLTTKLATRLTTTLTVALAVAACNSPSTPAPTPTKPMTVAPPTDRALPAADSREADLGKAVSHLLGTEHLVDTKVDDALSAQAFAEFLERLDGSKSYLLRSHVAELRAHEKLMDDELLGGDLVLARLSQAILKERRAAVAKVVAELLAGQFDFSIDETVEVDGEKLSFATTEDELRDRWRKTLKLRLLERTATMGKSRTALIEAIAKATSEEEKKSAGTALAKIPEAEADRVKKAQADMAKSFASRFARLAKAESLESAETFLNAVTSVYDPHTVYLAPAEQANFDIQMSGSLEGIGAQLVEDDVYIRITDIIPGGASDRQGKLKAGDLIMSVAQENEEPVDVADMRINQVVSMIRGRKNTIVTLVVKKPDDRIETVSITRDVVNIEAQYARGAEIDLGPGKAPMGLVYLPSFYGDTRSRPGQLPGRNATDDVRAILAELSRRKLGGVIVDLRGNGGGLLDHARDISGMFIKTGPIVQTRYGSGDSEVLSDRDATVEFSGDVVVLVDRFSASASEIVAAALQDYNRAIVVGTATHGKGTVQVLINLNRLARNRDKPLGVLKLTTQQFFRVNGGSTQWRGVIPDIALPDPNAHVESGERFLDHAIKYSEVPALDYAGEAKDTATLASALAKSAARVKSSKVFGRVAELSALAKARRERTVIPLKKDVWQARRTSDEKALEAADPKIGDGPELFKVSLISSARAKAGKNNRIETWRKNVARDPWIAESLHILADVAKAP